MSRHRNVRSMNYSDEYDGYDDVYGHSVEDDYCMSPSEAAFLYDREGSKGKQKIGAFFQTVTDIAEETEGELESKESSLSEVDRARLESCIEQMRHTLGSSVPRQDLVNVVLLYNFNVEKAINFILDSPQYKDVKPPERKEKDFSVSKSSKAFTIPKLNGVNPTNFAKVPLSSGSSNFSSLDELSRNHLQKFSVQETKPTADHSTNFGTLADLTSQHLNKINFNTRPDFTQIPKKPKDPELPSKIDRLSLDVSSLNLSRNPIKSETTIESNAWTIDLTKALRNTNSAPQLRSKNSSISSILPEMEDFVPAFIDCETEIEKQAAPRTCSMDSSWILTVKNANCKRASKFGKVLCRRYKRPKPYFVRTNIENISAIEPFAFDTPSPDDIISHHLNRK